MKPITRERLIEVLEYSPDTGVFKWRRQLSARMRVGSVAGSRNQLGYVQIKIDGGYYSASRLAWLYVHGTWPKLELDHIDRDRSNNRMANLRDVSRKQNMENVGVRGDNTSGLPGVSFDKRSGMWKAQIQHFKRKIGLGLHASIDEAYNAYCNARDALFTHHKVEGRQ